MEKDIDEIFLKVVSYVKEIIARLITVTNDGIEGEKVVLEIYNSTKDKRLIITGEQQLPWEEVLSKYPEPLFVVYKNIQGNWTIKTIRDDVFSYEPRKKLPESWAGKRDAE